MDIEQEGTNTKVLDREDCREEVISGVSLVTFTSNKRYQIVFKERTTRKMVVV